MNAHTFRPGVNVTAHATDGTTVIGVTARWLTGGDGYADTATVLTDAGHVTVWPRSIRVIASVPANA